MNWALILAIGWLLLAVPVAMLIGHAIHRSEVQNSASRATPPTDGRPTTAAGPAQGPRIVGAQPARRPRAR